MNFLTFIICLVSSFQFGWAINLHACEGEFIDLLCGNNDVIEIIHANYGRTSAKICSHKGQTTDTNCKAPGFQARISQICNNQRSCTVRANNGNFGDPCYGTFKYLEVEYKCVKSKTEQNRIVELQRLTELSTKLDEKYKLLETRIRKIESYIFNLPLNPEA